MVDSAECDGLAWRGGRGGCWLLDRCHVAAAVWDVRLFLLCYFDLETRKRIKELNRNYAGRPEAWGSPGLTGFEPIK